MDWGNVVDVSSFLLFESTGDSEADSDLNVSSSTEDMKMAEDDDAQSCCCDLSDTTVCVNEVFDFDNDRDYVVDDRNRHEDTEEEDDDAIDDQFWSGGTLGFVIGGQHKKSKVYVDSTVEMKDEMEKDRLFWETCLTS